jgi:formiminoglutamase/agmatinase
MRVQLDATPVVEAQTTPAHRYGLLGLPHDAPTSNARPGSRFAPGSLRKAFSSLLKVRIDGDRHVIADADRGEIDLTDVEISDFGDVVLSYDESSSTVAQMKAAVTQVVETGAFPIVIGGDHAITFPSVAAVHDHVGGRLGIIHFDAHADLLDKNDRQGRFSGSSPIRRSLELPGVSPSNVVQIGLRGYLTLQQYKDGEEFGVRRITAAELQRRGVESAITDAITWAKEGTDAVYLSIDTDVLDPSYAPGVGWPEPGGLTTQELSDAIQLVAPHVVAADIAELNPVYDSPHEATLMLMSRLLLDLVTARSLARA